MGHQVIMGLNHIMGIKRHGLISEDLKHKLNRRVLFFWNQVIQEWNGHIPIWKNVRDLGLTNRMTQEWEQIQKIMKLIDICWDADKDQNYMDWQDQGWRRGGGRRIQNTMLSRGK